MLKLSLLLVGYDKNLLAERKAALSALGHRVLVALTRHQAILLAASIPCDMAILCASIPDNDARIMGADLETVNPALAAVCLCDYPQVAQTGVATSLQHLLECASGSRPKARRHAAG